jgi:hypothetical protein
MRCHRDPGVSHDPKVETEIISRRRMVSLLGLAAALGLAVPATNAEAQTSGMERRGGRVEKRYERRGGTPAAKQPTPGQPAQGQPAQGQPAQGQPAQGQPRFRALRAHYSRTDDASGRAGFYGGSGFRRIPPINRTPRKLTGHGDPIREEEDRDHAQADCITMGSGPRQRGRRRLPRALTKSLRTGAVPLIYCWSGSFVST